MDISHFRELMCEHILVFKWLIVTILHAIWRPQVIHDKVWLQHIYARHQSSGCQVTSSATHTLDRDRKHQRVAAYASIIKNNINDK